MVSFFSAEFRRNPFPVYDHLREQTPILYDENTDALLVFDYDSVRLVLRLLSICALLVLAPCSARTQTATMTEDPAQGTVWDLRILYPAPAAWDAERATVEASLPSLARLKGTLGVSASSLQAALDRMGQTTQRLTRLDAYARLKADEDTSIAENQARVQTVTTLSQRFEEATAFVNPEILNIGRQQVEAFEAADPGLNRYKRPLELILRRTAHTLSPEGEGIIAATQSMRLQPGVTYSLMMYSDIPWPTVQVEGRSAAVDPEGYRRMLENPDREVRRKTFEAYLNTLAAYQSTLGSILRAYLSGPAFEAKVRHYPSSLALILSDDAMPEAPFATLIAETEKSRPILNRYFKLRRRVLGVDQLYLYDLSAPLAADTRRYRLDEAEDLILKAMAPLGDVYVHKLSVGFHSNVMHATVAPHKPAGAYTNPEAYGVLPFVLTSFSGNFDSVSAVAHEWGHSMHSQLAEGAQPFETATYSSFISDTPSLTHEMLLSDYMIAHASTRQEKIVALSQAIDLLRTSYFGVSLYARFELAAHEAADRGEPLTGQRLGEIYCSLLKDFYGGADGPVAIGPADCALWVHASRIVYDDFYLYKYMTATSAAAYFVEGLEKNDVDLRHSYFELLKTGGSDDPYMLLKRAGFDPASSEAYGPMIRRLDRLVQELESVVTLPGAPSAAAAGQR